MENLEDIIRVLRTADHILITSHVNSDGDSIGTLVGLGLALKSLGKEVIMVNPDPVPDVYRFLTGADQIIIPDQLEEVPDTVVLVDCSGLDRVGQVLAERIKEVPLLINIDHHISNAYFGHYNLVEVKAAAAAEIVVHLLQHWGIQFNKDIATALYTGILMDTGSFQYPSTTYTTHQTAAYLLQQGVDLDQVRGALFESRSPAVIKLIGEAMRSFQTCAEGKIAWIVVTQEILKCTGARVEHCDGLINFPRSIAGVEIAILFRELAPGKIKVGLRSKYGADVNQLAERFGGGGHKRAAGCLLDGSVEEVVERVIQAAKELLRGDFNSSIFIRG